MLITASMLFIASMYRLITAHLGHVVESSTPGAAGSTCVVISVDDVVDVLLIEVDDLSLLKRSAGSMA
jgi:hypothetical protein